MHAKMLGQLLGMNNDEALVRLVRTTNNLQSGRPSPAADAFGFPAQVRTTDYASAWFCPPWKQETLLNELMAVPKRG